MGSFTSGDIGLREIRLDGVAGRVAMCEAHWKAFTEDLPRCAYVRLYAALRRFCRDGADNFAPQLFHAGRDASGARIEEFVAHGARVVGRRATDGSIATFFVTDVQWKTGEVAAASPQPPRQGTLPLDMNMTREGVET